MRATGPRVAYTLDGVKPMVMDGRSADWVLVPARTAKACRRSSSRTARDAHAARAALDITRKFARFEFDQTPAELVGPPGDHAHLWRRIADDAACCSPPS